MPQQQFFADSPKEVGLDPAKVQALLDRAEREVKEGLLPSTQIAIARNGKIAAMRTVGSAVQGGANRPATNDTFYVIFSCTKAWRSAKRNRRKPTPSMPRLTVTPLCRRSCR